MTPRQVLAIGLCVLLNALAGFDVRPISFASPGIVKEWGIDRAALGVVLFSVLALRFTLRGLLIAAMLASVVMINVFGQGQPDLHALSLPATAGGFCTNASMIGLYAITAASFPTAVRSGGTGFVIGAGRGGAALSPVLAGFLFQSGLGLAAVSMVMAAGSLLGALALLMLPRRPAAGN